MRKKALELQRKNLEFQAKIIQIHFEISFLEIQIYSKWMISIFIFVLLRWQIQTEKKKLSKPSYNSLFYDILPKKEKKTYLGCKKLEPFGSLEVTGTFYFRRKAVGWTWRVEIFMKLDETFEIFVIFYVLT